MPSVAYMNQSAPFWDFIASLEQQGRSHPWFSQNQNENTEHGEAGHPSRPWTWGFGHSRPFPQFGGPAPPSSPPDNHPMGEENEKEDEKEKEKGNENGEGPSNNSGEDSEGGRGRGRHGRCGGRGRHRFGHHGYHHGQGGGFGPRHGPPHHGCGGGWGPWSGRGGPFGGGPFNPFGFAAGLFDPPAPTKDNNQDFTPDADIFDTPSSFVIHISLPGAKKEDVGVNWDAEKSELSIAGVVYRPGDEEFLKTLAMEERKIGPFERKIRLGTRANPAQIDAEGMTAKLEDGVLMIEVPKLEGEFVEVRKVDIE